MRRNIMIAVVVALSILSQGIAIASGGVIVRSSSGGLVFRRGEDDANGTIVSTGTTTIKIAELQDDGSLKTFDFADNTFKTTTVTTETASMTNRSMNNGADATGIWTYVLSTVTGFTKGKVYFVVTSNSLALPTIDRTEFEYGGSDGDLVLDTSGRVLLQPTQAGVTIPTVSTLLGSVTASSVTDKTGYSLTQTFPANFSSQSIDGSGKVLLQPVQTGVTIPTVTAVTGGVTVTTNNDKAGYSVSTVSDKTGYTLTQSFPSNFASASIDSSGRVLLQPTQTGVTIPIVTSLTNGVTVTTNSDKTGYTVDTNNDKTGYAITQSFPSNFAAMSVDSGGKLLLQAVQTGVTIPTVTTISGGVTVATNSDKTGYTVSTVTDKTGYALSSTEHSSVATDTQNGLTAQGFTPTRATKIDRLDASVSSISGGGGGGGGVGVTVSITSPPSSVYDGDVTTFSARVVGGANGVSWSSSAGTMNASTGSWTAPATGSGTATITATSIDSGSVTSTASVAYSPGPSVSLNQSNQTVAENASLSIMATISNSTAQTVVWSVSPSTPARLVTSGNTATFYAPSSSGSFTVKATIPGTGKSSSVTLTVP